MPANGRLLPWRARTVRGLPRACHPRARSSPVQQSKPDGSGERIIPLGHPTVVLHGGSGSRQQSAALVRLLAAGGPGREKAGGRPEDDALPNPVTAQGPHLGPPGKIPVVTVSGKGRRVSVAG